MANAVKQALGTETAFTITLASLATSAVGVGRQATLVDNSTNLFFGAKVFVKVTVGTSPTANTSIYVYFIGSNATPSISTDGAGASDAAWTAVNARLLGVISVPATTSDTAYYGVFDTAAFGPLPTKWAVGIVHDTAVNLNSTGGNHSVTYQGYNPNIV